MRVTKNKILLDFLLIVEQIYRLRYYVTSIAILPFLLERSYHSHYLWYEKIIKLIGLCNCGSIINDEVFLTIKSKECDADMLVLISQIVLCTNISLQHCFTLLSRQSTRQNLYYIINNCPLFVLQFVVYSTSQ